MREKKIFFVNKKKFAVLQIGARRGYVIPYILIFTKEIKKSFRKKTSFKSVKKVYKGHPIFGNIFSFK